MKKLKVFSNVKRCKVSNVKKSDSNLYEWTKSIILSLIIIVMGKNATFLVFNSYLAKYYGIPKIPHSERDGLLLGACLALFGIYFLGSIFIKLKLTHKPSNLSLDYIIVAFLLLMIQFHIMSS